MRSAASQATNAANTAANTGTSEGAGAAGINANLTPFLTQEMENPQGYSQQDMTQQLNQAEAGAGGATSGITGQAQLQAARQRNPGGFTGALDQAARSRTQAAADASEGIAANNANVKLQQQQAGANGLAGMYGADTNAMLRSMAMEPEDINSEVNADNSGWLQQTMGTLQGLGGLAANAGAVYKNL